MLCHSPQRVNHIPQFFDRLSLHSHFGSKIVSVIFEPLLGQIRQLGLGLLRNLSLLLFLSIILVFHLCILGLRRFIVLFGIWECLLLVRLTNFLLGIHL